MKLILHKYIELKVFLFHVCFIKPRFLFFLPILVRLILSPCLNR